MFCDIDLEDLQEVAALEGRMAISKGELSTIAFAKRTGQSFLSDDRQAKVLAKSVLKAESIQDIPHLMRTQ
jgi:predicted nucleic acid-binding protein